MKNKKQSLPGIKSIGFVETEKLSPNVMLKGICEIPVAVYADVTDVTFVSAPTCVLGDEYDKHGRLQTVTLNFATNDYIPMYKRLAFIVTDVNGQSYLIGAKEPPFPVMKLSINFGTPGGDSSTNLVEVKHVAIKSLLKCSFDEGV